MRGGKRLRAAFCYWGWRAAGAADERGRSSAAAAALEFFQAAALIHDDVMDDSDTRRGAPAVHRRFATLHRGGGWTGDGERFGLAGAVLAGDLCLVWSDELFTGSGLDPVALARGRRRLRPDAHRAHGRAVPRHARAGGGEPAPAGRAGAGPAGHPVQERQVHDRAPAAAGRPAGGRRRRPAGRVLRLRPAARARRSSCATTSSGCSATRPRPASRRATTCARASGRCWSRRPSRQASPAQAALVGRLLGDPGLDAGGVGRAARGAGGDRRAGGGRAHGRRPRRASRWRALDAMDVAEPARAVLAGLVVGGDGEGLLMTRRAERRRGSPAGCPAAPGPSRARPTTSSSSAPASRGCRRRCGWRARGAG